jgi:predicted nuclease of predicted toxin-antitoxin system
MDGHQVSYVAEETRSVSDGTVLHQANATHAIVVTTDKDFGELVFRQRRATSGVLPIRLAGLSARRKAWVVAEALREHGHEMPHAFTVVSPGMVRVRRES